MPKNDRSMRTIRSLVAVAAAAVLGLLSSVSGARAQSVTVSVAWNTPLRDIAPDAWGVNIPSFMTPADTHNAGWMRLVEEVTRRRPLIRIHGWGMLATRGPQAWLTPDRTWDAARIAEALRPVVRAGYRLMIDIPDGPNGGPDTPDPALASDPDAFARFAARLVKIVNMDNGFQVRDWELPNEREGHLPPAQMSALIRRASAAMKRVDPSIRVGGPALSWINTGYLAAVVRDCGSSLDFVTVHSYGGDGTAPSPQGYYDDAARDAAALHDLRARLDAATPGRRLPIYLDEYNIAWQGSPYNKDADGAVYDVLEATGAIHAGADTTEFWECADSDDWHSLIRNSTTRYPISNYLSLLNRFFFGQEVSAVTSDRTRVGAFATKGTDGGVTTRALVLVNRADTAQTVGLTSPDFAPARLREYVLDSLGYSGPIALRWPVAGGLPLPARSVVFLIGTSAAVPSAVTPPQPQVSRAPRPAAAASRRSPPGR